MKLCMVEVQLLIYQSSEKKFQKAAPGKFEQLIRWPYILHSQTDISACVNSVSLKMCQKLVLVVNFQFREKNFCGVAPGEF